MVISRFSDSEEDQERLMQQKGKNITTEVKLVQSKVSVHRGGAAAASSDPLWAASGERTMTRLPSK